MFHEEMAFAVLFKKKKTVDTLHICKILEYVCCKKNPISASLFLNFILRRAYELWIQNFSLSANNSYLHFPYLLALLKILFDPQVATQVESLMWLFSWKLEPTHVVCHDYGASYYACTSIRLQKFFASCEQIQHVSTG
jgi:hypothetical protein